MKYPIHHSIKEEHSLLAVKKTAIVNAVHSTLYQNGKYKTHARAVQLKELDRVYDVVNDRIQELEKHSDCLNSIRR